jgi:hypothetical protein
MLPFTLIKPAVGDDPSAQLELPQKRHSFIFAARGESQLLRDALLPG